MTKKVDRDKAKRKYQARYGYAPSDDTALTNFIAGLTHSDYNSVCADTSSSSGWDAGGSSSCDSGSSGSSCGGGGGCGGS
jgi:hypothetical protein